MDGMMPSNNPTNTKVINNGYVMPGRGYHDSQSSAMADSYLASNSSLETNYHHHGTNTPSGSMSSASAVVAENLYNTPQQNYFQSSNASPAAYYHHEQTLSSQMSQMNLENIRAKSNYGEGSSVGPHPKMMGTNQRVVHEMMNVTNENANSSYFVLDFLREDILKKLHKNQELSTKNNSDLPLAVDVYVELSPIEKMPGITSCTFNQFQSSVYRATHSENGQYYCLRRFHGIQGQPPNGRLLMSTIDSWKKLQHPNIAPLRQIFTTKAFGDNSVIFVYDYYPAPETLLNCYFSAQIPRGGPGVGGSGGSLSNGYSTSSRPYSQQQNTPKVLPEPVLWNFIIQIASALRTMHQAGLAFRALDPSKILLTSGWSTNPNNFFSNRGRNARLRLAFAGVQDILDTFEAFHMPNNQRAFTHHYQQEDLVRFGRIILALATNQLSAFTQLNNDSSAGPNGGPGGPGNGSGTGPGSSPASAGIAIQQYLEMVPRSYSSDLRNLIQFLVSGKPGATAKLHSIDEIMPIIGARFFLQLDNAYTKYDYLYDELTKEIDNGRLLRLLLKLGTINERPEHQMDPNWSETGDRYMLKLFRDYLFHQHYDDDNRPFFDLGYIVSTLNKFDVGSPEKICLQSRDQQNILIVSFEELKRCFEGALTDLSQH